MTFITPVCVVTIPSPPTWFHVCQSSLEPSHEKNEQRACLGLSVIPVTLVSGPSFFAR